MRLKKFTALIFAAALLLCFSVVAFAEGTEFTGSDYTFTVPEEFVYQANGLTSEDDPVWALVGIGDASSKIDEYQERSVVSEFFTSDGSFSFALRVLSNDSTEEIYTLASMTDEELDDFLLDQIGTSTDEVTVEGGFIDKIDNQPFYRVKLDVDSDDGEAHELLFGTVINGHSIIFDAYSAADDIDEDEEALMLEALQSIKFTEITEKAETSPVNSAVLMLLLLLLLIVIISPAIYMPIQKRRDKRQKAWLAKRMEEYRKEHKELSGEAKFINSTDCTRETIQAFSRYHAYIKNLPSLLLGLVICCAVLICALAFDLTWWVKLVAGGVTIYWLYKAIIMPSNIEKIQTKVFQRGLSETAHYSFYDEGFRVSGIQSASIYGYFQLSSAKKSGRFIYLYYGADNVYPVDIMGFEKGESDEFLEFIKEKIQKEKEDK